MYSLVSILMGILMASDLGRMFSTNLTHIPMGFPRKLFLWVFLWLVSWAGCFHQAHQLFLWLFLWSFPMRIPMASGLGIVFSLKLPAIPMGNPMELFLWVFIFLVA